MNGFIDSALKFFCSSGSLIEDSVIFVRFEKDEVNTGNDGFNSETYFGHIVYKRTDDDPENISPPLMLKTMRKELGQFQELLPRFYDSHVHVNHIYDNFLLIFENLQPRGFRTADRNSFLDVDHLSLMVRKLGNFHSYSYLAKCHPQVAKKFQFLATWFHETQNGFSAYNPKFLCNRCHRGFQRLRRDEEGYANKLTYAEKLASEAVAFMQRINTTEHENAMSVLCHGDYIRGNVLFRYESQQNEKKPVDLKMIDMACCRVGSPIIDLSTVLYLNADQNTRNRHWDYLIDTYYSGLCELFGGEGVPSKDNILNEFRTKAFYGYIVASYFLPSTIAVDQGKKVLFELMPTEFAHCNFTDLPPEVLDSIYKNVGGEEGTQALVHILKDMIDRGFV